MSNVAVEDGGEGEDASGLSSMECLHRSALASSQPAGPAASLMNHGSWWLPQGCCATVTERNNYFHVQTQEVNEVRNVVFERNNALKELVKARAHVVH